MLLIGKILRTVPRPHNKGKSVRQCCCLRSWLGNGNFHSIMRYKSQDKKVHKCFSKGLVGGHFFIFYLKTFILWKIYKNNENSTSLNHVKLPKCDNFLVKNGNFIFQMKMKPISHHPPSAIIDTWSISFNPKPTHYSGKLEWFEVNHDGSFSYFIFSVRYSNGSKFKRHITFYTFNIYNFCQFTLP